MRETKDLRLATEGEKNSVMTLVKAIVEACRGYSAQICAAALVITLEELKSETGIKVDWLGEANKDEH